MDDTHHDHITRLNAEIVFLIQERDTWRQAALRYHKEANALLKRCHDLEEQCVRETSHVMQLAEEILYLRGDMSDLELRPRH